MTSNISNKAPHSRASERHHPAADRHILTDVLTLAEASSVTEISLGPAIGAMTFIKTNQHVSCACRESPAQLLRDDVRLSFDGFMLHVDLGYRIDV
jgi:hypothetical protein